MLGLLAEITVPIPMTDVGGVLAVRGWPIQIPLQAGWISDSQLLRQVRDGRRWNVSRINQDSLQEPDGGELNTEPEPRVIFP